MRKTKKNENKKLYLEISKLIKEIRKFVVKLKKNHIV